MASMESDKNIINTDTDTDTNTNAVDTGVDEINDGVDERNDGVDEINDGVDERSDNDLINTDRNTSMREKIKNTFINLAYNIFSVLLEGALRIKEFKQSCQNFFARRRQQQQTNTDNSNYNFFPNNYHIVFFSKPLLCFIDGEIYYNHDDYDEKYDYSFLLDSSKYTVNAENTNEWLNNNYILYRDTHSRNDIIPYLQITYENKTYFYQLHNSHTITKIHNLIYSTNDNIDAKYILDTDDNTDDDNGVDTDGGGVGVGVGDGNESDDNDSLPIVVNIDNEYESFNDLLNNEYKPYIQSNVKLCIQFYGNPRVTHQISCELQKVINQYAFTNNHIYIGHILGEIYDRESVIFDALSKFVFQSHSNSDDEFELNINIENINHCCDFNNDTYIFKSSERKTDEIPDIFKFNSTLFSNKMFIG